MNRITNLHHTYKYVMPDLIRHPGVSGFRVALRLPGMTNYDTVK